MGMRGEISDRDNTFILLVNGRMVNQRSHFGAVTELENWDMNDIEKIEDHQGPGFSYLRARSRCRRHKHNHKERDHFARQ